MNTALWVMQGLVAVAMLGAGAMKIVTPRLKLVEKFKWPATWSDANVKLLGLAEVLGALGLVLPWGLAVVPILTPIAAVALAIIMAGAVKTHLDIKDPPYAPVVLGGLCGVIALGRFGLF